MELRNFDFSQFLGLKLGCRPECEGLLFYHVSCIFVEGDSNLISMRQSNFNVKHSSFTLIAFYSLRSVGIEVKASLGIGLQQILLK